MLEGYVARLYERGGDFGGGCERLKIRGLEVAADAVRFEGCGVEKAEVEGEVCEGAGGDAAAAGAAGEADVVDIFGTVDVEA